MATRAEKDQAIAELMEVIKGTNVLYLADASSLNSEATANLRRACFNGGVRMQVVKNTLLRKAMERIENKDYSALFPTLTGQTALMIAEKGNAQSVSVRWAVKAPDGKTLGDVKQANDVPKGALDNGWGGAATAVAEAAATGIFDIVKRYR